MEELLLLIFTYLFVFLFYEFFFILPQKSNKKKEKKELLEIRYLKMKYPLDFDKISKPQLLQICGLLSSFDISIVVTVVANIQNFWLKILIGLILVFVLIIISYHFVYLFYKKKGMVKNGKDK